MPEAVTSVPTHNRPEAKIFVRYILRINMQGWQISSLINTVVLGENKILPLIHIN
jgi:hypothetical protein